MLTPPYPEKYCRLGWGVGVANFLGRLMSESRVGKHDLKFDAAPDCFQPPKTGCRPRRLRLPLWTTPSQSQEPLLSSSHISCLRFFYLVLAFQS